MTPEQRKMLLMMEMEAEATAAEQNQKKSRYPRLSQLNRGIADTAGGVVDLLNPFDPWTGSAATGLASGMRSAGIEVAEEAPQGAVEGFFRGAGNAAGAALPAAAVARAVSAFSGVVGAAAKDAFTALSTRLGFNLELASGGAAGSAETVAREEGVGPVGQTVAALAAGAAAPAAVIGAPRAATAVAQAAPITGRAIRGFRAAVTPYTQEGATNVARNRVQGLAGGPERAEELARRIDPDSPLSPAQQTEDAAILGLEQAGGRADPALGDRLAERVQANLARLRTEAASFGGDASIADTRAAVEARRKIFRDNLGRQIADAQKRADQRIAELGPQRTETDNSLIVGEEIRKSFREAQDLEGRLWAAVPKQAVLPTANSKDAVARIVAATPRSQAKNIPQDALRFLGKEGEYGDRESVNELHGLYSSLREEARNAMAGTNQNRNRARIANEVADAILRDLATDDPSSEVGRLINIAREYSREVHQLFDQGSVGRLLRRTIQSDEQIPMELTLDRTVGRGGAAGDTAYQDVSRAIGTTNDAGLVAQDAVEDYLRRRFTETALTSDGKFSERAALSFVRSNRQLLDRFPDLRNRFLSATRDKTGAEALAMRGNSRLARASNPRESIGARFVESPEGREIETILSAQNPGRAAREIVAQARRDKTGQAVAGLKGAFARHLIGKATPREGINSVNLREMLRDPRTMGAMRQIFSGPEIARFGRMADELTKLDNIGNAISIDSVSNVKPPALIAFVARTFAARQGAKAGAGTSGASLLTANFASKRMQEIIEGLTNDRATRIILDALEDPQLFRALLTDPASVAQSERAIRSLAPYVTGATAAATTEE